MMTAERVAADNGAGLDDAQQLAERLNARRGRRHRMIPGPEWVETDRILRAWRRGWRSEAPPGAAAVRDVLEPYMAMARNHPVILALDVTPHGRVTTACEPAVPTASADTPLPLLWAVLSNDRVRPRLKPCRRCDRWFVDRSKNSVRVFCGSRCRDGWWTRARRRAGGASRGSDGETGDDAGVGGAGAGAGRRDRGRQRRDVV